MKLYQNKTSGMNGGFSVCYKSVINDYFLGTAHKITNANGAKTINDWISKETLNKLLLMKRWMKKARKQQ